MIQSLRQIKRRIRSVENTEKITRAMETVATTKLKRYQDFLEQTRTYAHELERMLRNLLLAAPNLTHPFFNQTRKSQQTLVIVIASDAGLCGAYNTNVFEQLENVLNRTSSPVSFLTVGRQGERYLARKGHQIIGSLPEPRTMEIESTAAKLNEMSAQAFLDGSADCVFLVSTQFISLSSHQPVAKQLLPLKDFETKRNCLAKQNLIVEPNDGHVLRALVPQHLRMTIKQWLIEALVSEQASRMLAMRQASDNAEDMIDTLTLARNKARQAAITKELIEVVSASKAQQLK
jgi:F-type H+-transporting ATPase subunit gamma